MISYRPSFADLRMVSDFLSAVRNEIALDIRAIEMAGFNPAHFGKIPRPSRWIGQAQRFPILTRIIHLIALRIWRYFAPSLFLFQSLAFRSKSLPYAPIRFDETGQVLAFSRRTVDIVHLRHIDSIPTQWIEMPWLPLSELPTGAEIISIANLLDDADIRRSLYLANLAHCLIESRRGMSGWGLQSYTAWRWFAARIAVDKLPGPLLMTEHFDRWAVLADRSVRQTRLARHLTLMQHGSVNANVTPSGLGFSLPTRLNGVSHLRAYSAADVDIFRGEILSPSSCHRRLGVSFYRSIIKLTEMASKEERPSILFVGHPLCEAAHRALLAALRLEGPWEAFYKPHPSCSISRSARNHSWTLVEGHAIFPRVDLLISYPSTLVGEYASHGIEAVVHRMNINAVEILEYIPEIIKKIRHSRSNTLDPMQFLG